MPDKNFGVKNITFVSGSGTPTITSPDNLNINASIVTIGTGITFNANTGIISASSFTGSIGTSADSNKLSGQDPCFYTNYNNFYNTPEEVWTDIKQGGIGAGVTITGITTSYTFSSNRTVAGVSTNKLTVTGHLYYPTSSYIGPNVDVVVLYHGTIETAGVSPLDSAQTFINIATNPTQVNLRDKIVFSVAYPQDAVPVWVNNIEDPATEFPEFSSVLNFNTFYFGDNIYHAEAALLWVKEKLNSYMSSVGIAKSISRVYTFGHSQGAYLTHRLNTMYHVDGVISNAPGPIDLLDRCSGVAQTSTYTCNKIRVGIGSTLGAPDAYNSRSLKNYLSGTLSPTLFTQALDDDAYQVNLMQTVMQLGLSSCTEYGPIQFNYYASGGHASFATSSFVQRDIRNYVNSGYTGSYTFYNVGIGTTNPTSALTVKGTSALENLTVSGVSTFSNTIVVGTGKSLTFGDAGANYLKLYSDGSNTYINQQNMGKLIIDASGSQRTLEITDSQASQTMAKFLGNGGAVELYHNNNKRLETTGAGVTVTGTTFTNQLNVSGVATAATLKDSIGNVRAIPQNSVGVAYTLAVTDVGKHVAITTGGITVPASVFSIGDNVTVFNNSDYNQMITPGSGVTLRRAGVGDTGSRGLNGYGLATILCINTNSFVITGAGLT